MRGTGFTPTAASGTITEKNRRKEGADMADVSIVRCEKYDMEAAEAALLQVLEPLGGLDWVKSGMRVAIKANLVSSLKPEAAATTHPVLLCALTKLLVQRGAQVVVGDSPGGLYTPAYVNRVYAATGVGAVEEFGGRLNRNFEQKTAHFPEAIAAKTFQYTAYLDEADAIINFCKLKSHGMMSLSAAVKNMFGTVPGTVKPEYHFRFPDPMDFAGMLLDLNRYFKPKLCIVDAVVAMEGNGPTAGKPRPLGAILAGTDPGKLDLVCARVIGLDPQRVPTLVKAMACGLLLQTEEPEAAGWSEDFVAADFDRIENCVSTQFDAQLPGVLGKIFGGVAKGALASVPAVRARECVGCGQCAGICPAHAIGMKNRLPHIDRSVCIRCFCCQEFCPKGAMKVRRPLPAKILSR